MNIQLSIKEETIKFVFALSLGWLHNFKTLSFRSVQVSKLYLIVTDEDEEPVIKDEDGGRQCLWLLLLTAELEGKCALEEASYLLDWLLSLFAEVGALSSDGC